MTNSLEYSEFMYTISEITFIILMIFLIYLTSLKNNLSLHHLFFNMRLEFVELKALLPTKFQGK